MPIGLHVERGLKVGARLRMRVREHFLSCVAGFQVLQLPVGSMVVPFGGSYLESYKVSPKRNDHGAYGYGLATSCVTEAYARCHLRPCSCPCALNKTYVYLRSGAAEHLVHGTYDGWDKAP